MDTDPQPMSPAEVFREWQRCLATGEQEAQSR